MKIETVLPVLAISLSIMLIGTPSFVSAAITPALTWNVSQTNPVVSWNLFAEQLIDLDKVSSFDHTYSPVKVDRTFALMHVAIYDSLVVAKSQGRNDLSESAITAGTASEVLSSIFPDQGERVTLFRDKHLAGIKGYEHEQVMIAYNLGREVGSRIVAYGMTDNSDKIFTDPIPTGPCKWTGTNPVTPFARTWKTYFVESGQEFTPVPPHECGSPADLAELQEVQDVAKTRTTEQADKARKYGDETTYIWSYELNARIVEHDMDVFDAARAHAYLQAGMFDSFVTTWNAKYIFWTERPEKRLEIRQVIPSPNFPSYPSGHAAVSSTASMIMAEIFPEEMDYFQRLAEEIAMSRLWAGVHYRQDNDQGLLLGQMVGEKVVRDMRRGPHAIVADSLDDSVCKEDYVMLVKPSTGSPACVKPTTAPVLMQRGWVMPAHY